MPAPLAYFLSWHTYGTWLHGREEGSVDQKHNSLGMPFLLGNRALEMFRRESLRQTPYTLDEPRRSVVLQTLIEVAAHRRWQLWAIHVRTNHVHVVVVAPASPERVMNDLKAWASRRLRERFDELGDRNRWAEHGSTRWINTPTSLDAAISYVLDEQGEKMAYYDGRDQREE